MKLIAGFLLGSLLAVHGAVDSRVITSNYCAGAGVTTPAAREFIFQFIEGVERLGLLTNLVDLAFFAEGQNVASGAPISLNNTGVVVGEINRIKGGYWFDNHTNNFGLVFTNLPPTPNGRTLIAWGAPAFHKNISNNVNDVIFELTGPGGPLPTPNPALSFVFLGGGNPNAYVFNGSQQWIGGAAPVYAPNSIFAASIASDASQAVFRYRTDYPKAVGAFETPLPVTASPTVLRFGIRNALGNTKCGWPGLIRGFAYLNIRLGPEQMDALDLLVPRIGVAFEGDSKTIGNPWPHFFCEATNTWGLCSTITNSAVGGTVVAAANAQNSMEHRWPRIQEFETNRQFPRIIYALRGGHNDFRGPSIATYGGITNAFRAITNLWAAARNHGFLAMGWTIDRTGTTWSEGGINRTCLTMLNGWLRDHQNLCDFWMDAESWFVDEFGETPYTNQAIYAYDPVNPVHETALGAELLGRAAGNAQNIALPEPPFTISVNSADLPHRKCLIELRGSPAGRTARIYASADLRDWKPIAELVPSAGWAVFEDYILEGTVRRYYKAAALP
jgi:hypothetical protein